MYKDGLDKYRGWLFFGDILILVSTFALVLRLWWLNEWAWQDMFSAALWMSLGVYFIAMHMFGLYEVRVNYNANKITTLISILGAVILANLGLSFLFYLIPAVKFPRSVFVIQMVVVIPFLFLWRINFWRVRQESLIAKRVVIVGAGEAGHTAESILRQLGTEYTVIGFVDDDPAKHADTVSGRKVLGTSVDLPSLVSTHKVDGIVVAVVGPKQQNLFDAVLQCRLNGAFISDLMTLGEELTGRILLSHVRDSWFVYSPGFLILHHRMFRRVKRLTDIVFAAVGLFLAYPIVLIAAVLIKLESKGPVYFRQTRIGQNERPFIALKLRTMVDSGENAGSLYTTLKDPRVTRCGRVFRFLRIDEIPQMWNVLKGDMSFIGPRAEWDLLVKEYKDKIPYYSIRHVVKPGITGWAQVNYPHGASLGDASRKLEYDLYYIKNMSVGLDLKILIKTISVVLFGKGSQ